MNRTRIMEATILILSDNAVDAGIVKKLLDVEFDKIYVSAESAMDSADFDRYRPNVLILAFNGLEQAERYYLGMYRQQGAIHLNLHRAIVLCNKDEVERAYRLCREAVFDDYMLFWPMTNDPFRLPMTVHQALREMNLSAVSSPSTADWAAQMKRVSSMGKEMNQQLEQGNRHIESMDRAVREADSQAYAAFDNFSQRLVRNEVPGVTVVRNNEVLQNEIGRAKQEIIEVPRSKLENSVTPLKQWAGKLSESATPHMESLRELDALASKAPPTLLVVDDEAFQHKILGFMLKEARYQTMFSSSVAEALEILNNKELPDLILMDVMLPGINGVEAVRLIKSNERMEKVPIIMMTGNSEKDVLQASLQAGACDFIVKPFASNTLLNKLNQALGRKAACH